MAEGGETTTNKGGRAPGSQVATYRPRRSTARNHRVMVRLTDTEWEALGQAAEAAGMRPTSYLARAAEMVAQERPTVPEALLIELRQIRRQAQGMGTNLNQLARANNSGAAIDPEQAEAILGSVVVTMRKAAALMDQIMDAQQ